MHLEVAWLQPDSQAERQGAVAPTPPPPPARKQETRGNRKENKTHPQTKTAKRAPPPHPPPPQRRPRHYPAACFHPSGRDAWETSGWGFSHISLHHDANGRGPGFSGLTRARAIFAASSGKGKGNEAKPNPQWQKAPGHCCEKATEGGQAPELPDSHSGRKRRIKGPIPAPATPTPHPHPHPLQTTPSSQKREGRSHVCAKGAKRTNDAPLGTADSWEPWPQPAGPCRSRWWVDTFAVNPWPRRSTDPPRRDPTPGTRGRTYRVRCWRSRTKPWWESRTDAADCWPSGPGPSRSGPWRAGGGSAPIYVNRGGCVDGGDAPGLFRRRDPGQESSGASGLPRARPVPQTPKVHRWAGRAVRGLWFVALPRSGWGQPRAQGPSAVPRELTAREFPWGPFDVAGHAPLPSLPCLPSRSGFSRLFTFHTSLDLNCPRRLLRGMAGHPMLSPMPPPRSLAFLASVPHAPPQLLRALLASFPCSSPRPPPPGL